METIKKKILIIEDDEHISKVYEIKFAKENVTTIVARDGEDGVAKIKSERPDIILLDLMIPKKDGFGVLEDIKKIPEFAKIPVLVLSNLGQKSDQERAMSLGATEYLVKVDHPIQEVINKVKEYLSL
jgi:DNA-binding response OmpR family regulator